MDNDRELRIELSGIARARLCPQKDMDNDRELRIEVRMCPHCQKPSGRPIVHGMPTMESVFRAKMGELILGGCVVDESTKECGCLECHAEWDPEEWFLLMRRRAEAGGV
jgi:hypothetical protein